MTRLRGVAGPLCLWLVVMVSLGLMVANSQAQERADLIDRFQSRADNGSNIVAAYVDDAFSAERRLIHEVSRDGWKPEDFAANADLAGIPSALLLDRDGRLVAITPANPDLIGSELASNYAHLSRALAGRPSVSNVISSVSDDEYRPTSLPADGDPVVAMALPVLTSSRAFVLSGEFNLSQGTLASFFARQAVAGTRVLLLDSTGDVIASSGESTLSQSTFDRIEMSLEEPIAAGDRVVAGEAVQGTDWIYVLDTPRQTLLAPGNDNDLGQWALFAAAALVSLAGLIVNERAKSDRIRARFEKEQVDQRLRNTVENAPVGMTLVDLDYRFMEPNKRLCHMLGYSTEELAALTFQDVTHPDDLGMDLAFLTQLVNGEIESYELEKRYVHKDGSLLWGRLTVSVLRGEDGEIGYFVSQIEDVTEVRKARAELQHRALYDPLTGLANRSLLMDRLTVSLSNDRNQVNVGVGFCDLDHFKAINDTYGHQVGDEVLKEVARRLQESVRADDTVARLGGDEFVIVLHGVTSRDEATAVLDRARRAIEEPIVIDGVSLRTGLSVGLAVAAHGGDPDVLLRDADAAMYVAKNAGRGRIASARMPSGVPSAIRV